MDRIKEINQELDRLYQCETGLYHEYASHFGLSDTAFWLLYTLCGTEENLTQNQIADLWHMPRQSVNSAAASLVKKGYLVLEKLALARNNKGLRLTAEGKKFCERAILPFYELEERAIRSMNEAELTMFLEISRKQCAFLQREIRVITGTAQNRSCVSK